MTRDTSLFNIAHMDRIVEAVSRVRRSHDSVVLLECLELKVHAELAAEVWLAVLHVLVEIEHSNGPEPSSANNNVFERSRHCRHLVESLQILDCAWRRQVIYNRYVDLVAVIVFHYIRNCSLALWRCFERVSSRYVQNHISVERLEQVGGSRNHGFLFDRVICLWPSGLLSQRAADFLQEQSRRPAWLSA